MSATANQSTATAVDDQPRKLSLDQMLAWRPPLTVETGAYVALFVVGFALRFWDLAARTMHHDESLHAVYSWYLVEGRGYEHHPLMHGPLLFHLMALVYVLFGVSDATARFVPAGFGAAMVLMPLLLRPWLGRVGAIAAAALIALSPSLLYFSRFVGAGAQDILVAVGMLMIAAGIWHYQRDGRPRWLYVFSVGLAIGFTTKEVTYMLAAIVILYLDGVVAAALARQTGEARGWNETRVRLMALALAPVAWAVVLFWPWIMRLRERWQLGELPRAAGPLVLAGTFSAPFFAASVELVLRRLDIGLAEPAPFGGWTNEQFYGAITIGALLALGAQFGTAWHKREWLTNALIFWGISIPLFTTFFTNREGIATGIWGSLDYWLEQQDVHRGAQPVFYYLVVAPVYEFVTIGLAGAGLVYWGIRTGRDTTLALAGAVLLALAGAVLGDGAHTSLIFVVPALLLATYALRARPFQQFVFFWLAAMLLGLSAAGEKMPWLVVHLALPLTLLAALTVDEAWRAGARIRWPQRVRTAGPPAILGLACAALALLSDRFGWANPALALALIAGVAACIVLVVRRQAAVALAAVALFLGFTAPLSVRAAIMAAFTHGDIPKELLVYTQSSPQLHDIQRQIEELARTSGMGKNLPVTVDATEAFTWPWAWYLRDYKNVGYPELSSYRNNANLLNSLQPGSVLLAEFANSDIGVLRSDIYGPGQQYKHRWWHPEDYKGMTTAKFFAKLREADSWRYWGAYFLHRTPRPALGSIDAVAFFPIGHDTPTAGASETGPEPRLEPGGRLIAGEAGRGRGQLQRPAGLAVDLGGNVYVADSRNNRVQKFGPDGRLVAVLGGPRLFNEPWGVAVDGDGHVYVADTWNHRIHKFDAALNPILTWGEPSRQAGQPNPPLTELYGPRDIAIDLEGNIWVTDTGHSRLVKYSPDGRPLGAYGGIGQGPGQFQEPVSIDIAPNGDILVTDVWNGRVQRFDKDFGHKGEVRIDGWADRGPENKPYLAVAASGEVYVSVPDGGQVLRFGADGRPLGPFATFNTGAGGRPRPLGIAVDPEGRVWIADAAAGTLTRLTPP